MQHLAFHHNVAAQRLWLAAATPCCVRQSEASFLANLWQGQPAANCADPVDACRVDAG
jgi:hypothetical protein